MTELHLTTENIKVVLTLLILAAAIYSFIREKISPDVTALLVMIALLLTTILTPLEAFSGFSHPATISVAAVLVLSAAIERTGALAFVARRLLAPLGKSEFLLTFVLMLLIGIMSAFINNTAAVAVFIPIVMEVCRRTGASPGRVLMPMSHAATLGGMCTLIGTSTNLVAHEFARQHGLPGFTMFELGKVGLPIFIIGFTYMLLVGRLFLPRNQHNQAVPFEGDKRYLIEVILQPAAQLVGRKIAAEHFEHNFDVLLVGVRRNGQTLDLNNPDEVYAVGDSLLLSGALDKVLLLSSQSGFELHRPQHNASLNPALLQQSEKQRLTLAEVVVLVTSGLVGQTLKAVHFADRYNAVVLALRRRGVMTERPSTTPLHAGDVLIVEGEHAALQELSDAHGFLVIGTAQSPELRPRGLFITLLTVIGVVVVASFGLLPIVTAAAAGCAVLMLTGCLRPREAYQAIDLSLVFLLAGSLALGIALDKTGITALLAKLLTGMSGITGPYLVLVGFFIISVITSELMSNSGTVAFFGPLALSVAHQMGINPMTLLVAVTFGSSAAFAMPIGYQTSLMIYGPGGYRMRDFVKMGLVLDLLLAILSLWLIPYFWPF